MPLRAAPLALLALLAPSCDDGGPADTGDSPGPPPVDADADGWPEGQDCDDLDASVHPGAYEACDGVDNDCDGYADHEDPQYDGGTWYADADGDGWGAGDPLCAGGEGTSKVPDDCDDDDAAVYPDAREVCDGVDDDCDGLVDDEDDSLDISTATTWYTDADGDGHGDATSPVLACEMPPDASADATDCEDDEALAFPGSHATEVPADGVDQDCDGIDACLDLTCDAWTDLVLPGWGAGGDPTWDLEDEGSVAASASGGTAVYPGGEAGYAAADAVLLEESGASSAVVEDFDGDGYLDLAAGIYANRGTEAGRTRVWWGGPDGFSTASRTLLPSEGVRRLVAADLDGDGWTDLVGAVAREGDSWDASSIVWWGSATGFSDSDATVLPTPGAQDVAAADLDEDGDLDLAFACARDDATYSVDSRVYWNHAGFAAADVTALPTTGASRVLAEDLDADGDLDLFFVAFRGARTYRADSSLYWNASGAFSEGDRTLLYAQGGTDAVAVDLDSDGWTDLVVSHWRSDTGYLSDSRAWWGSAEGIDGKAATSLSSDGAAGVAVADLDDDGALDVIIAQTRDNDGARSSSAILWGRPGTPRSFTVGSVGVEGATGVLARDLDGDGWTDLVFAAGGSEAAPDAVPMVVWNEGGTLATPVPLAATGSLAAPVAVGR